MKKINWDELYRKNSSALKGVCRRYVGNEEIADDLVHETFATAIDKINSFKGTGPIEGWIRKIAVNKALLYLRERQLLYVPIEMVPEKAEQVSEMGKMLNNIRETIERASFSTDELLSVIDALPVHHKAVFNLYVIEGFSHQQIASMMNISTGTSKSHLSRARKKAQELLFEKATGQPSKKKHRHTALLLLLFRPNPIDSIFRKGFDGFGLTVTTPMPNALPTAATTLATSAVGAGNIVMASFIALAIGGGSYWLTTQNQQHHSPVPATAPQLATDTIVPPAITLPDSAQRETVEPEATKPKTIVVKKKIVVRDTIRLEKPTTK